MCERGVGRAPDGRRRRIAGGAEIGQMGIGDIIRRTQLNAAQVNG